MGRISGDCIHWLPQGVDWRDMGEGDKKFPVWDFPPFSSFTHFIIYMRESPVHTNAEDLKSIFLSTTQLNTHYTLILVLIFAFCFQIFPHTPPSLIHHRPQSPLTLWGCPKPLQPPNPSTERTMTPTIIKMTMFLTCVPRNVLCLNKSSQHTNRPSWSSTHMEPIRDGFRPRHW